MGQYPVTVFEKCCAVLAHFSVDPDIFCPYVVCFLKQNARQIGQWSAAVFRPAFFHPVECPEEIDGSRSAGCQDGKTIIHLFCEPGWNFFGKSDGFQGDSIGCRNADGRCTSDNHSPDGVGNTSG